MEQGRENLNQFLAALTREETEKVMRYRFEEDKIRSALGAWMMHRAFAEDYPAERYEITRNAYGKPCYPPHLLKKKPAYFNLSHAGDLVVLAKADTDLGVDVEQIRPVDFSRFRTVFSEEELRRIQQAAAPQEAFFALWTKKEAFVKCIGKGMTALGEYDEKADAFTYTVHRREGHIITVCSETAEALGGIKVLEPELDLTQNEIAYAKERGKEIIYHSKAGETE